MTGIIFCIVDSKGPAHYYREGRRGPQHPQCSHSPTQITPAKWKDREKSDRTVKNISNQQHNITFLPSYKISLKFENENKKNGLHLVERLLYLTHL